MQDIHDALLMQQLMQENYVEKWPQRHNYRFIFNYIVLNLLPLLDQYNSNIVITLTIWQDFIHMLIEPQLIYSSFISLITALEC
jgi:hypothetical protein